MPGQTPPVPGQAPPVVGNATRSVPALAGAFDMAFLPSGGRPMTLQIAAGQVAAGEVAAGADWTLTPTAAQVAARPGPHILTGPDGRTQIRVLSLRVPGGALVAGTSLDQVYETIVRVELIVILGSIAVVLLIGLGVFAVLRRGLRPIEAMAAQADRITAGGLTDRVRAHHPGSEVGRLGTALNGMLARIEADVAEREASQQQMRRFFADASHELRTPLASLRANAELCQQGALSSPDQVDEVMSRIVAETRRMGQLVDDMLRLARLGQHPVRSCQPVDLTAALTGCAQRARIADPARTWRVQIPDGLATVGDEELLRRAVDNLLMNVLVHTPAGTTATIAAGQAGGQVTIEVSDDGPGVAPDQMPHLFERFYRASRPGTRGSGLGLAIAAEIVSAHGGSASAAPAAPPSAPASAAPASAAPPSAASPRGLRITLTLPEARHAREPAGTGGQLAVR